MLVGIIYKLKYYEIVSLGSKVMFIANLYLLFLQESVICVKKTNKSDYFTKHFFVLSFFKDSFPQESRVLP